MPFRISPNNADLPGVPEVEGIAAGRGGGGAGTGGGGGGAAKPGIRGPLGGGGGRGGGGIALDEDEEGIVA